MATTSSALAGGGPTCIAQRNRSATSGVSARGNGDVPGGGRGGALNVPGADGGCSGRVAVAVDGRAGEDGEDGPTASGAAGVRSPSASPGLGSTAGTGRNLSSAERQLGGMSSRQIGHRLESRLEEARAWATNFKTHPPQKMWLQGSATGPVRSSKQMAHASRPFSARPRPFSTSLSAPPAAPPPAELGSGVGGGAAPDGRGGEGVEGAGTGAGVDLGNEGWLVMVC
mmetsp:Transcript_41517/g.95949  ORF Transcript_41517/g.95949 Transcript_41517/m.95949 type:complete len:227 (+) Transcript_41517:1067-1747(+)